MRPEPTSECVQIAVLNARHLLLIERLDREMNLLRNEFADRFTTFRETHVKSHEREHEQEQHAADLAMRNMDRRLESMNEFRAQIANTESKYATKNEASAMESKLEVQIATVQDRLRLTETAAIGDRGKLLDKDVVDARFRGLERLVYMASGALGFLMILLSVLTFLKK